MITAQTLAKGAAERHLSVLGILDISDDPDTPAQSNRLALLGPAPDSFWPAFQRSEEARDGKADPIDRWSRRVIGNWACDLKGKALFPFGGPPIGHSCDGQWKAGAPGHPPWAHWSTTTLD